MPILDFAESRPDKHTDRVGWNKSWERDLKITYSNIQRGAPVLPVNSKARQFINTVLPHTRLYAERATRNACELQTDLAKYSAQQFASDDFAEKWKALTQQRREELVLEGLWQASCAGPDMEDRRKWCPEMTIEFLAGNGGQKFLTLLVKLIPEDLDVSITEPTLIPHPMVERLLRAGSMTAIGPGIRLHRAYFISFTLWRILLAFYGKEEHYVIAKPPRQEASSGVLKEAVKNLNMDPDELREMRRVEKIFKKRREDQVHVCWNCGKDAAHLEAGKVLKACSTCKKVGHSIRYCSRECQKDDWKKGVPRPHKSICGKPLTGAPVEPKPEVEVDERIPTPDVGLKRTPALIYQISLLKQPPHCDYFFMFPPPKDDIGITLAPSDFKDMLLTMRDIALRSGDKYAVRMMFELLTPAAKDSQFPIADLKKQLKNEYDVDVDTVDMETMP